MTFSQNINPSPDCTFYILHFVVSAVQPIKVKLNKWLKIRLWLSALCVFYSLPHWVNIVVICIHIPSRFSTMQQDYHSYIIHLIWCVSTHKLKPNVYTSNSVCWNTTIHVTVSISTDWILLVSICVSTQKAFKSKYFLSHLNNNCLEMCYTNNFMCAMCSI